MTTTPNPDAAHNTARTLPELQAAVTPGAIRERFRTPPSKSYLRDFVYGAIDGTVTTFAVVAGVAGAQLSAGVVVVLGIANLVGDGFSMAVSNYLGTRADQQLRDRHRRMEAEHIRKVPEGEREEIRQIFANKGFTGDDLERAVETITSDRDRWIDTMLTEELGVQLDSPNALWAAWTTFAAFVVFGTIPLLVYIYQVAAQPAARLADPFLPAAVLTGVTFFLVGALKSRVVECSFWRSGLETLLMGSVAAGLAFGIGALLRGVATVA